MNDRVGERDVEKKKKNVCSRDFLHGLEEKTLVQKSVQKATVMVAASSRREDGVRSVAYSMEVRWFVLMRP